MGFKIEEGLAIDKVFTELAEGSFPNQVQPVYSGSYAMVPGYYGENL